MKMLCLVSFDSQLVTEKKFIQNLFMLNKVKFSHMMSKVGVAIKINPLERIGLKFL